MQHAEHQAPDQGIIHHGEAGTAADNDILPAHSHDLSHQAAGFPGAEQQAIVAVIHAVLSHNGSGGIRNGPHGIGERQLFCVRLAPCHIEAEPPGLDLTVLLPQFFPQGCQLL